MPRFLIIEDDPQNARFLAEGMRELQAEVCVCLDGIEGLTQAVTGHWDAIVLDRMLPDGFDGLKILQALRSTGNNTPVLVLSALSTTDERVRCLKAGCDDYLTKPFAFSELQARLEALLRRVSAHAPEPVLEVADLKLNLLSRHEIGRAHV